jgi:class 3 adenylate cyclase
MRNETWRCSSNGGPLARPGRTAGCARHERGRTPPDHRDVLRSRRLHRAVDAARPEDLREVIAAYHKCAAETVTRFGGYVAKYMGDGVLVYFGYPEAHEDDAENAVRGALALVDAVTRQFAQSGRQQVRIGLATGLVVVGELLGTGEVQERNVVGETPNLAARLQAAPAPDTVVVDATTRRLAGELFEYEAVAPTALKATPPCCGRGASICTHPSRSFWKNDFPTSPRRRRK